MSLKFSRLTHVYYVTFLFIAIGVVIFSNKIFLNQFQTESTSSVFYSSIQLDNLEKNSWPKAIKRSVQQDQLKEFEGQFNLYADKVKSVQDVVKSDEYSKLDKSANKLKESIGKLRSLTDISSVMLVLNNKTIEFQNYVQQNRWPTLTRLSSKVKVTINAKRIQSSNKFSKSRLNYIHKEITKDIKQMTNVTNASTLSIAYKKAIVSKLDSFRTELNMIKQYLMALSTYEKSFYLFKTHYMNWMQTAGPVLSMKKMNLEKGSGNQDSLMYLLAAFFLIGILGGFFLYRRDMKVGQRLIEKTILKSVQEGIIPRENKLHLNSSAKFEQDFDGLREYVQKRMSFGAIFQEAMPFSSLLLDSNLKLVWANNLFYDHWNLKDYMSDNTITWDFLQRYTNLGENDPVLNALNDGIAGIYQIQVLDPKKEDADDENRVAPYEMYVSPVEYMGQTRIMIFFYPMRSIEDSMMEQSRAIVAPVAKTLDALLNNQFNQDFREKINKDFDIAGISEIFDKFKKYNHLVTQQKHGLLTEIERVESELIDEYKVIEDVKIVLNEENGLQQKIIADIDRTKKAVVQVIDLRYQLEKEYEKSLAADNDSLMFRKTTLNKFSAAEDALAENLKGFNSLSKIRKDFKELKGKLEDSRSRIMQSFNKSVGDLKTGADRDQNNENFDKVKTQIRGLERLLIAFGEVVTGLDVSLSKIELIAQQTDLPKFDEIQKNVNTAKAKLDFDIKQLKSIMDLGSQGDQNVVDSLTGLYSKFQAQRKNGKKLKEVLQSEELEQNDENLDVDSKRRVV